MAPSYHPFSLSSVASSSGYIANGSPSSPNAPAPLQQLDSFTTVFSSPPSTPLAVVCDMLPYDASSSSSSSGSSAESSPQSLGADSSPKIAVTDDKEDTQNVH